MSCLGGDCDCKPVAVMPEWPEIFGEPLGFPAPAAEKLAAETVPSSGGATSEWDRWATLRADLEVSDDSDEDEQANRSDTRGTDLWAQVRKDLELSDDSDSEDGDIDEGERAVKISSADVGAKRLRGLAGNSSSSSVLTAAKSLVAPPFPARVHRAAGPPPRATPVGRSRQVYDPRTAAIPVVGFCPPLEARTRNHPAAEGRKRVWDDEVIVGPPAKTQRKSSHGGGVSGNGNATRPRRPILHLLRRRFAKANPNMRI